MSCFSAQCVWHPFVSLKRNPRHKGRCGGTRRGIPIPTLNPGHLEALWERKPHSDPWDQSCIPAFTKVIFILLHLKKPLKQPNRASALAGSRWDMLLLLATS